MKVYSKLLLSMLCMPFIAHADSLELSEHANIPSKRTAMHTLIAVGLRLAETAAGMQMLWRGTPHVTDFFYFYEDETEIRPGVLRNAYCQTIRKRSMVPLGFIKLVQRIPTRFIGGVITFDGLQGLLKEYNQSVDDRVTRERELLFGQKK